MTKIGILVECGREGLEAVVLKRICDLLKSAHKSDAAIDLVTMDNKEKLINGCGTAAEVLFDDGCERVFIVWDERPAWPKLGEKPCWHRDRTDILGILEKAKLPEGKVHLVCIEREFESWLLFDHAMLSVVLSRKTHPVTVPKQKNPDRMQNPKSVMTTLFKQLGGLTYVDVEFAKRFAKHLTGLSHLRRCTTFKRFEQFYITACQK